jgi:hypothetical protein
MVGRVVASFGDVAVGDADTDQSAEATSTLRSSRKAGHGEWRRQDGMVRDIETRLERVERAGR